MKVFINNYEFEASYFAYDGCHKIYILEDESDESEALDYGYEILPINLLKEKYNESCDLKFIRNWKLDKLYARQFENAKILVEVC